MRNIFKQLFKDSRGQALPLMLCALAIGGLTISGSVNYANTNIISSQIIRDSVQGVYAAEAGIEETLWNLLHGISPSTELADNFNNMTVSIETEYQGEFTMVFGELIEPSGHSDYIGISGNITWDDIAGAYKYTINATSQHQSTIFIAEVGARLPDGYAYQEGSAALFPDNMSCEEPDISIGGSGAYMVNWVMSPPRPGVSTSNPTETQTFYITHVSGSGEIHGEYVWLIAAESDIGGVGEITGERYGITSEAIMQNVTRTSSRIKADIIIAGGAAYIVTWQILN